MSESNQEDEAPKKGISYSKLIADAKTDPFDGKKLAAEFLEQNRLSLKSILDMTLPSMNLLMPSVNSLMIAGTQELLSSIASPALEILNHHTQIAVQQILNPWSDDALDFIEMYRLREAEMDARIAEAATALGLDVDALSEHWTFDDLEERAELAQLAQRVAREGTPEAVAALHTAIASGTRAGRGRQHIKPGPKPRTLEEVVEMIDKWRPWHLNGHSQQEFADHMGWDSRTILTDCIAIYRKNFGSHSI